MEILRLRSEVRDIFLPFEPLLPDLAGCSDHLLLCAHDSINELRGLRILQLESTRGDQAVRAPAKL